MRKSVTLYKVERPYWSCVAETSPGQPLSISSGSPDNEFFALVADGEKAALLAALLQKREAPSAADLDDRLLQALVAQFDGFDFHNPFDDIQAFLRLHGIPFQTSSWLTA